MLILLLILVIKEIYFDGHTPEPSYLDSSTDSFSVGPVQKTPPSCDLLDVVIRKMTCSWQEKSCLTWGRCGETKQLDMESPCS